MYLLRWPSDALRRLDEQTYKVFVRKVTNYFKPSSNMFSRLELDTDKTRELCRIGCCLIDFLLSSSASTLTDATSTSSSSERRFGGVGVGSNSGAATLAYHESAVLLDDLLQDVFACVKEVIESNNPHECSFSPTMLSNTASQLYFLFIGWNKYKFIDHRYVTDSVV